MEKINKVLDFYILTNSLKDKIRSGVSLWHISKDRLESVAEHIYGTCMLAIALDSEYDFNIDIKKAILMLTIHELEECYIGDLTPFDNITREEKIEKGEQAVSEILSGLVKKEEYLQLTKEYNRKTTPEAIFASNCDKLEMLLQMKIYEELGYSDINLDENKILLENNWVKELINNGASTIAELFFDFHIPSFENELKFKEIATYAKYNLVTKRKTK